MYNLRFDKERKELIISPMKSGVMPCGDEVVKYNNYYYTCNTRKPLRAKAETIKAVWIAEAERELEKAENTTIITKYGKINQK